MNTKETPEEKRRRAALEEKEEWHKTTQWFRRLWKALNYWLLPIVIMIILIIAAIFTATPLLIGNNTPTQEHDATLQKFVNVTKQADYSNETREILAWLVTWNNDSSVSILETAVNRSDNSSASYNNTLSIFESTQSATNYLNGLDKSNYNLTSTNFKTSDAPILKNITGSDPNVYVQWVKTEGSILNGTYKVTVLMQYDNIIAIKSAKLLSLGSGASSETTASSIPAIISI